VNPHQAENGHADSRYLQLWKAAAHRGGNLILYDTAVTKKGADELKKALPKLSISMR
jgi:hypothetical protein